MDYEQQTSRFFNYWCSVIFLMALFPPREYAGERRSSPSPSRGFLFSPSLGVWQGGDSMTIVEVNIGKMLAEWAVVVSLTGICLVAFRRLSSHT